MLLLTAQDISRVMTMRDAIEVDKKAFILQTRERCIMPLRINFDIEPGDGQILFMPAHIKDVGATGIKIISVFSSNAARGKPVVPATMILMNDETGEVEALLDGTALTRLRTGALSGAATEVLARADARIGALFGTGGQAASQLSAMLEVRKLSEVRVYDADSSRTTAFVASERRAAEEKGVRLVPMTDPNKAVDGADVITTVTTSKYPVFDGDRVAAGAHVNGIGSYTPDKAELPPDLLARAGRIFVDNMEAVLKEAGDLIQPIANGLFGPDRIAGELGSVLIGSVPGRRSDSEITVFKAVGFAALDVLCAREIATRAIAAGVGRKIDI